MSSLILAWVLTSIPSTIATLFIIRDQAGSSFRWIDLVIEKENAIMMLIGVVFPALMLAGIAAAGAHHTICDQRRRRIRAIIRNWEKVSIDYRHVKVKADQENYAQVIEDMRANMTQLSDKDLKFLAGLDPETDKVDKLIMDAITDELIERQLLK